MATKRTQARRLTDLEHAVKELAEALKSLSSVQLRQIQEQVEGSLRDHELETVRVSMVKAKKVAEWHGKE